MAENKSNITIFNRIWVYSRAEAERMKNVNHSISSENIKLGTVVTDGGIAQPYTSIVRNKSQIREADAVIVASGDMRKIHYTPHQLN